MYTLSGKAVKELQGLKSFIRTEVLKLQREGLTSSQASTPYVRCGKTTAVNFAYPASGNTFEVRLGSPDFDTETVGSQTLTFTAYTPEENEVRVCHSIDGLYYPENTHVLIANIAGKWYILKGGPTRLVGLTAEAITSAIGPYNIDTLKGVDGVCNYSEPLSAYNTHGWDADDNSAVRVEWVGENSRWEIYQVDCPAS